eukprot:12462131-Alexandrium_andersonii.AAC.1
MASGVRNLNCAVPEQISELAPNSTPARPRPGGLASFRALSPMAATKRAPRAKDCADCRLEEFGLEPANSRFRALGPP